MPLPLLLLPHRPHQKSIPVAVSVAVCVALALAHALALVAPVEFAAVAHALALVHAVVLFPTADNGNHTSQCSAIRARAPEKHGAASRRS